MAESKFQRPCDVGERADMGRFLKLAHRVELTLDTEVLNKDAPMQIDPNEILVSYNNRRGAPPNVPHVHFGVLKSFKTKGFDRKRSQTGIRIKYVSAEVKRKLLEHNMRFSRGNRLLPPIYPEKALYGSVSNSHYNLSLRCIKCNVVGPMGTSRA